MLSSSFLIIDSFVSTVFKISSSDILTSSALEENQQSLHYIMTDLLDDFYNATLQGNRKEHLSSELKYLSNAIKENQNKKNIVEGLASNMHIKNPNAQEITKLLDKYTKKLDSKDCTNEEYLAIYNKVSGSLDRKSVV